MINMDTFSTADCAIYWDIRKKIAKQTKEVLINDLRELSITIERAMQYLKEAAFDNKFPEVRFPIGNNWEYKLLIHIFDGPSPLYYRLCIHESKTDENIAELECEKHNIYTYILKGANSDLFERETIN